MGENLTILIKVINCGNGPGRVTVVLRSFVLRKIVTKRGCRSRNQGHAVVLKTSKTFVAADVDPDLKP